MHGTPHVATGVGCYQIHLDEFACENNIIVIGGLDAEILVEFDGRNHGAPTALVVILQGIIHYRG